MIILKKIINQKNFLYQLIKFEIYLFKFVMDYIIYTQYILNYLKIIKKKNNIIHHDLKLQNILIKDEIIKIADVGYSSLQKPFEFFTNKGVINFLKKILLYKR